MISAVKKVKQGDVVDSEWLGAVLLARTVREGLSEEWPFELSPE